MKASIQDFINTTKSGDVVDVATSEYSIDRIESTGWNPKYRMTYQSVKSMEKKGVVKAEFFWRGCRVTRI